MSPTCPVVLLIETLRERGFAPFSCLIKHELATQAFSTTALVSRREYLQILLEWPRLGPKLAPMRSDEPLGFFECWLKGKEVPGGKPAAFHKKVLKGDDAEGADAGSAAICDDVVCAGPASVAPVDDDDVVRASAVVARAPSPSGSSSSSSSSSSSDSDSVVRASADEPGLPSVIGGQRVNVERRS